MVEHSFLTDYTLVSLLPYHVILLEKKSVLSKCFSSIQVHASNNSNTCHPHSYRRLTKHIHSC